MKNKKLIEIPPYYIDTLVHPTRPPLCPHPSCLDLRRQLTARANAASVGQFSQPTRRVINCETRDTSCYTGGFQLNMEKLFLTRLVTAQEAECPLPTGSPPSVFWFFTRERSSKGLLFTLLLFLLLLLFLVLLG
jgi:hypothetical protein